MFKTKKFWYILLFAILWLVVAGSSFFHAIAFFGLANNLWMSIILALAFEIGQAAVLFSLLTSTKDRSRFIPWALMGMFTLVQVVGNVFSSYKYLVTNSVENLRYFKEPIFIWTDLPDQEATVIVTWAIGAILPIAALLLTSMITNYLTDQSEENNSPILLPETTEIKNDIDGPPEGEGLSEQQEIDNLNVALDKKDEEIDNLKKELEQLKNPSKNQEEQKNKLEINEDTNQSTEDKKEEERIERIEGEESQPEENQESSREDKRIESEFRETTEQSNPENHTKDGERGTNRFFREETQRIEKSNESELNKKPSHFVNL